MPAEKIPRGMDFRDLDSRSAMDSLLQAFHQFSDLLFVLFCGHFGGKIF